MATQTHGGLEGLFVHQMAHLFFMFSMGFLIFWLRKWHLTLSLSWRYIQYAAFFFIVWNLDTVVSHWMLEQSGLIKIRNLPPMQIQIVPMEGRSWLATAYYITKLDHLFCVPALVFLFLGLRRLLSTVISQKNREQEQP
jgi:hypothetical protein